MHEMGIAVEIVRVALTSIPESMRGVKVETVNVKIGRLAGVVRESLEFCFEAAIHDTPLKGARLEIEEVPISLRCRDCGSVSTGENAEFTCTQCQGAKLEIVTGQELMVTSLELEEPKPATPASEPGA